MSLLQSSLITQSANLPNKLEESIHLGFVASNQAREIARNVQNQNSLRAKASYVNAKARISMIASPNLGTLTSTFEPSDSRRMTIVGDSSQRRPPSSEPIYVTGNTGVTFRPMPILMTDEERVSTSVPSQPAAIRSSHTPATRPMQRTPTSLLLTRSSPQADDDRLLEGLSNASELSRFPPTTAQRRESERDSGPAEQELEHLRREVATLKSERDDHHRQHRELMSLLSSRLDSMRNSNSTDGPVSIFARLSSLERNGSSGDAVRRSTNLTGFPSPRRNLPPPKNPAAKTSPQHPRRDPPASSFPLETGEGYRGEHERAEEELGRALEMLRRAKSAATFLKQISHSEEEKTKQLSAETYTILSDAARHNYAIQSHNNQAMRSLSPHFESNFPASGYTTIEAEASVFD